jgi:hypothetical protein
MVVSLRSCTIYLVMLGDNAARFAFVAFGRSLLGSRVRRWLVVSQAAPQPTWALMIAGGRQRRQHTGHSAQRFAHV